MYTVWLLKPNDGITATVLQKTTKMQMVTEKVSICYTLKEVMFEKVIFLESGTCDCLLCF